MLTIKPSIVRIGDKISVEHKSNRGIVTTLTGVVASRNDHGDTRHLLTAEGAVLLTWNAKENNAVKVMLISRAEVEQQPLFGMEEIRERIA